MNNTATALTYQRGLSLLWVGIGSALLALAAMAALFSMRHERNLFAEGVGLLSSQANAGPVAKAKEAVKAAKGDAKAEAPSGGELRRCVIDGVTTISNVDCSDKNPTTRKIVIRDNRSSDIPKKPAAPVPASAAAPASAPTSTPAVDKIIEKQLQ